MTSTASALAPSTLKFDDKFVASYINELSAFIFLHDITTVLINDDTEIFGVNAITVGFRNPLPGYTMFDNMTAKLAGIRKAHKQIPVIIDGLESTGEYYTGDNPNKDCDNLDWYNQIVERLTELNLIKLDMKKIDNIEYMVTMGTKPKGLDIGHVVNKYATGKSKLKEGYNRKSKIENTIREVKNYDIKQAYRSKRYEIRRLLSRILGCNTSECDMLITFNNDVPDI